MLLDYFPEPLKDLYTAEEIAQVLHIDVRIVSLLEKLGLQSVIVGTDKRFFRGDIEQFLDALERKLNQKPKQGAA